MITYTTLLTGKGNAEKFANKFGELFDGESENSVDWYALGTSVANGFNIVIETLSGFVSNPQNWANVGASLGKAVLGFINGIKWEEVKSTITGGINGVFAAINTFLETLPWDQIGSDIWTFIEDIVKGINWSGEGGVADSIKNGINGVIAATTKFLTDFETDGLVEGFNTFLYKTTDGIDWLGLAEGITQALIDVVMICYDAIFGLAGLLDHAMGKLFEAVGWDKGAKYMYEAEQGAYKELQRGKDEFFKPLKTQISLAIQKQKDDALKDIKTSAGEIADEMESAGTQAAEGVGRGGKTVSQKLDIIGNDVEKSISDTLDKVTQDVQTSGNDISAKVSGTAADIQTKVSETLPGLSEDIIVTNEEISASVKQEAEESKQAFFESLERMGLDASKYSSDISGSITQMTADIKQAVHEHVSDIEQTSSDTWENIKTDTSEKVSGIVDDTKKQYDGMETDLSETMSQMQSSMSGKWDEIGKDTSTQLDSMTTSVKGTSWEGHGSNLVNGLLQGMKNSWASVTSWTRSSMHDLNNLITTTFEINSPSGVWAWFGQMLMAGLVKGLDDNSSDVFASVGDIARGINDEAESIEALSIDTNTGRLAGALDSITSRLEAVSEAFRHISDTLGGVLTPTLAYGMEIPYQARISDVGMSVPGENVDITDTLDDQTYVLRQIRNLLERLHLKIDGEDIVRGVSSAQRGIQRAYGGV